MSHSSHTPVTFTREEARQIREALGTPAAKMSCPRCGGTLELQGPMAGGGTTVPMYQVRCSPCHRSAIINESPGSQRPAD